ncbi:MAG: hypothetical protein ACI85H_000777 [Paracoccaceae bacterium]|jgi:hypothetical protein
MILRLILKLALRLHDGLLNPKPSYDNKGRNWHPKIGQRTQ